MVRSSHAQPSATDARAVNRSRDIDRTAAVHEEPWTAGGTSTGADKELTAEWGAISDGAAMKASTLARVTPGSVTQSSNMAISANFVERGHGM